MIVLWTTLTVMAWFIGLVIYFFIRGAIDPMAGNWLATTIAGLIASIPLGVAQGMVARGYVPPSIWTVATMMGVLPGIHLFDQGYKLLSYEPPAFTYGIIFGLGLGVAQYLVLRGTYTRAWWWFISSVLCYFVAFLSLGLFAVWAIPEGADGTSLFPLWLFGIPLIVGGIGGLGTGVAWAFLKSEGNHR
ncbi:MAG: hypothetical protein H0T73_17065 [Ardenticatenales bacterium]|nr:hypothetical protein [Ardenticatenales bacterium]